MKSESVSVIIPAYNASAYLGQAIESVLAQTYQNFEIIVVDDGSTDETPQIIERFGKAVQSIHQSNQGLSGARNTGIRNSNTEIIALLDADDLWEPEFLESMMDLLQKNPHAAGVYSGFQYIDATGRILGKPSLKVVHPDDFYQSLLTGGNWLVPSAVVLRKSHVYEVGLFDEEIGPVADTDLWEKLSRTGLLMGIPKALVQYRRHGSNMSNDPERMVTAAYRLTEKKFGPADGDLSSWPKKKVVAYSHHYKSASVRYLSAGNIKKSADYLRKLAAVSLDHLFSMDVWRALARAHVPDEYQFDSSFELKWNKVQGDVEGVLKELDQEKIKPSGIRDEYARIKASAYLALADEAGRAGKMRQAYKWLRVASGSYSRLWLARPFWGTVARSLYYKTSST